MIFDVDLHISTSLFRVISSLVFVTNSANKFQLCPRHFKFFAVQDLCWQQSCFGFVYLNFQEAIPPPEVAAALSVPIPRSQLPTITSFQRPSDQHFIL